MTRVSNRTICFTVTAVAVVALAVAASEARAQCATCVTPTVAYSPVVVPTATTVVQPTVVRTGWYPGWLLDRLRLNRWGAATPTVTTNYMPTYTASYAPTTYAAAYAPAPYITGYAPLQTAVVQTSYLPVTTAPACSSCATTTVAPVTTTSYAPSTVYRPVEVAPVVQSAVVEAAPACCPTDPCGACAACSGTITQATYLPSSTSIAAPGCASCAAASTSGPTYGSSAAASGSTQSVPSAGPPTGQPNLPADFAAPTTSGYAPGSQSPAGSNSPNQQSIKTPGPEPDDEGAGSATDGAAGENGAEAGAAEPTTSWNFEAPPLIGPRNNDRTANRPTVDVHNAVYRQPAANSNVSTSAAKPVVNANGWYSVSER